MKNNKKKLFSAIKEMGTRIKILPGTIKLFAVILIILAVYAGVTQKQIADNVVRLHIVANSDSASDQELKLKVRDAILEHVQEEYPDGATRDEAAGYLKKSLPVIQEIAAGILKENGSQETASVNYGVYSFPTKEYDGLALPAGMYEAVRVELGSAQGENWWCIMFPPLCVADASSLKLDEEAMSQLKEGMGASNYQLITDITERGNAPIKIKFRIIEIMENSKIRLAEMINNLF